VKSNVPEAEVMTASPRLLLFCMRDTLIAGIAQAVAASTYRNGLP